MFSFKGIKFESLLIRVFLVSRKENEKKPEPWTDEKFLGIEAIIGPGLESQNDEKRNKI